MHNICPFTKNPCRENLDSAKHEQFMCTKNPCFTVVVKVYIRNTKKVVKPQHIHVLIDIYMAGRSRVTFSPTTAPPASSSSLSLTLTPACSRQKS